jgi:glycosyltransferase involved in cell wall biosynthesis
MFYLWCLLNFLNNSYDVIHAHDFDTLPISYFLTLINNKKHKFIYDMHDFPLIYVNNLPFSNKIILFIYHFISKYVDKSIVVNDAFFNYFTKLGINSIKIVNIMNVPYKKSIKLSRDSINKNFNILYYGLLTRERGIQNLIKAIKPLNNVKLKIAGNGELSEWIINLQKNNPNISYLGFISLKELNIVIKSSDLIPILYFPNSLNQFFAAPNKFFISLCNGIPVIVPDKTYMSYLTKKYNCGLIVNVHNINEITICIKYLIENKNNYKK